MDAKTKLKMFSQNPSFWPEFIDFLMDGNEVRFSPWGMATVSVPPFFRDCMVRAAKEMEVLDFQYQATCGNKGLRKAITHSFANFAHFPNCDPEKNVAVAMGAIGMIEFIIKLLIRKPEDEMMVFEPVYPYHFQGLRDKGVGVAARSFHNPKTNRFELDFDDFRAKLNKNTKLVILCNPNNPTGRVFSREEYQRLTDILNDFPHVRVLEDCAYCVYLNDSQKLTYFHELGNNFAKTYTVFSAGKIFNTTGNRLGWVFADAPLVQQYFQYANGFYFPSAMEQRIYELAFMESIKPFMGFQNFWEYHTDDNTKRLRYLTKGLDKLGVKWLPSEGSYYVLMDADKLAKKVQPEYFQTYGNNTQFDPSRDAAVCRKLFLVHNTGCFPLSRIMINDGKCDGWIRIAFNRSYEDLDFLLEKLALLLKGN
jgi:aspartate/methionine/tyrosine aminotransferase